jgi:hypothetical protein
MIFESVASFQVWPYVFMSRDKFGCLGTLSFSEIMQLCLIEMTEISGDFGGKCVEFMDQLTISHKSASVQLHAVLQRCSWSLI